MLNGLDLRGVLFDLDGTLLDTAPDLYFAFCTALETEGLKPTPLAEIRPYISHGSAAMIEYALNGSKTEKTVSRILQNMLATYAQNIAVRSRLFDGMQRVLDEIENANLLWGVITNKHAQFSEPLLKALNLFERSACVISGDTTPKMKPHPEPLFEACRQIKLEPRNCIYIGDSEKDIQAGKHAGMLTVVAHYGYIAAADNAHTWGAHAGIDQPSDLLELIDRSSHLLS